MNRSLKSLLPLWGRFFIVLLLMAITYSYAMFQGGFVSWFIFYSLLPFFLYSLLLTFVPIQIRQVNREIQPTRLQRGDTAQVTVTFQNRSWFPFLFMTIQEVGAEGSKLDERLKGKASTVFFVGWKRNFQWTYELQQMERGEYPLHSLLFTCTDFFGWIVRKKIVSNEQLILVFPKVTPLSYNQLQLYSKGGALTPLSFHKETSTISSVREYQAGDRFSWIHWKSFAKNATLQTKEFEDYQKQEILLTIDRSTKNHFEEVIELAASMMQAVVSQGGEISFLSLGDNRVYLPNVKTSVQLDNLMTHLAIVQPDVEEGLDHVLKKELQQIHSTTLLVITGELTESLHQFFINGVQFIESVICLVIVDEQDIEGMKQVQINKPNVKVIPISHRMFHHVFTEVMKP